jgi:hypothetical protein
MTFDVTFRHQQALDPSALTTITATLHAITAAITDCRNAGKDIEQDPAIILLARHLSTVCQSRPDDTQLRQTCLQDIADIRRFPALRVLAHRGVAYDEAAKRVFHAEGRAAMQRLASALRLSPGTFDVRSNKGGPAVSGEITLHSNDVWVQLSLSSLGPDNEITFRRVQGRKDYTGGRNHRASVVELLAPDRFAERLCRELGLHLPAMHGEQLFA